MKQHITVEQLNQLSEKGADRYFKFSKKFPDNALIHELQDWVHHDEKTGNDYPVYYPLLSIGQMIEFLIKNFDKQINKNYCISDVVVDFDYSGELADALWEAVKDVLDEER